jgi:biopolymer transport protein ExbB
LPAPVCVFHAQSLTLRFVLPNLLTRAKVRAFQLSGVNHVFSIIEAAGWPIWPLLFASVIAVALIIERTAALRRSKIVPAGLLQSAVAEYRQSGISDAQLARLEAHSPLGRVLAAGMRNTKSSREIMKESIEEAGRAVAHELERFLTTLGTIATIAR